MRNQPAQNIASFQVAVTDRTAAHKRIQYAGRKARLLSISLEAEFNYITFVPVDHCTDDESHWSVSAGPHFHTYGLVS